MRNGRATKPRALKLVAAGDSIDAESRGAVLLTGPRFASWTPSGGMAGTWLPNLNRPSFPYSVLGAGGRGESTRQRPPLPRTTRPAAPQEPATKNFDLGNDETRATGAAGRGGQGRGGDAAAGTPALHFAVAAATSRRCRLTAVGRRPATSGDQSGAEPVSFVGYVAGRGALTS